MYDTQQIKPATIAKQIKLDTLSILSSMSFLLRIGMAYSYVNQ